MVGGNTAEGNVEISANETGDFDTFALRFVVFYAVVANVNIRSNQHLSGIRWVGEYFLVTGHAGVEAYFTRGGTRFSGRFPVENSPIFK